MLPSISLSLLLLAQTPAPPSAPITPTCYRARQPITVDGDLAEWDRRGPIEIDQESQRNLFEGNRISRDWQGPADASATVYLTYDEDNLYLGGEVKDDLRSHDAKVWWNGDCIELFLDLDRDGDREIRVWDDDDYQICLMPYFAGRSWGVSKHGRASLLSDEGLEGIEVASRPTAAAGYTFEVRLPFRNFPVFDPAAGKLGFNLAVHDFDDLPDGERRHSYLTVSGASQIYSDTENFLDLRFIGRPFVKGPVSRGWSRKAAPWVVSLFASLLIIILVAWISRPIFEWVNLRLRSWRRIGLGVMLFLLFAVFGAPFLVARFMEWRAENEFEERSLVVGQLVADLSEEIRLHEGRGLDTPDHLLDLLRGAPVATRPLYHYTCFEVDQSERGRNLILSSEGVPVRNYGFQLASGKQLSFPLPEPTGMSRLFVFGSARFDDRALQRPGASAVREHAVEIGVLMADGTERTEYYPAIDRQRLAERAAPVSDRFGLAFEDGGRPVEQYFVGPATVGDGLVKAVVVALRDPAVEFLLHGVTYARAEASGTLLPLGLARTSLAGPPAPLWDGIPRGVARAATRASGRSRLTVPIGKALDTLWVFYNTIDSRVLDAELNGVAVGRLLVRTAAGGEVVRDLRAGDEISFGLVDPAQRPADMESALAFRWEAEGASQLIEVLEQRVSAGDGPVEVTELILENGGELGGISLFAVTGGVLAAPVRTGGSPRLADSGAEVSVVTELVALVRGLDLAVYEGGKVAAVGFRDRDLGVSLKGSKYPLGGALAGADGSDIARATLAGELYLVRHYDLGRDNGRQLTIAAARKVQGLALLWRLQRQAGIASLILIIPLLLFYVIDRATRIAKLRLRLTTILIATSLAPIVILFAVLYNVVASDRARLRESQGNAAMRDVHARLEDMFNQTQRTTEEIVDSDVVRGILEHGEIGRERIENYLKELVSLQPAPGLDLAVRLEVKTVDGQRLRFHDAPERETASRFDLTEGGIHYCWGKLVFLWTLDRVGRDHDVRVTVAGEVTPGWAGDLGRATSSRVSLLTLRGFPIAGSSPGDPELRSRDVENIRQQNQSVFRVNTADELITTNLLSAAPGDEPAALVEVALPPDEFRLDVVFTTLPLETFFFWLCVVALVAAVFMGAIATWRITQPVEALERAARRVAEGDLDVSVESQARGEVGRLAQSFNTMTAKLRYRAAERERLERAMGQLTATIEPDATADAALAALSEEPRAVACALYRRDSERERLLLMGRARTGDRPFPVRLPQNGNWERVLQDREARILAADEATTSPDSDWGVLGGNLTLVLPLPLSDRAVGVAVLQYGPEVTRLELSEHLPALNQLAGQIAVALENARLYRLAVADPLTGLYVDAYFQNRLAEEVDRAQHRKARLSLLRIDVKDLERLERDQGPGAVRNMLVRLAVAIRSESREMYVIARAGHTFQVLLPETGAEGATEFRDRVLRAIEAINAGRKETARLHAHAGLAVFPDDGRSPAFLMDAAAASLAGARRKKVRQALFAPGAEGAEDPLAQLDYHPYVFLSRKMKDLLVQVGRVAQSRASVLLLGETGVGKEVLADLLHRWSDRSDRPFVAINCSAVPETLLEAELFGYERGAFTGADRPRQGRFEQADGGTVFLDEVGDMPLSIQAKLLRVLQDQLVVRLGSRQPTAVDVRVIAATNRDLAARIQAGTFRNDLYFRLNVVSLTVPPLRERREDIPALVDLMVGEFNRDNSRRIRGVSPAALDCLHRYEWPGNVRELANVLKRAMLMTEGDLVLPGNLEFEGRPGPPARKAILESSHNDSLAEVGGEPGDGPLNERQQRLLQHLEAGATIRSREFYEMVGVSPRTGLRDLNDLIERGMIIRLGSRRAATYRLP